MGRLLNWFKVISYLITILAEIAIAIGCIWAYHEIERLNGRVAELENVEYLMQIDNRTYYITYNTTIIINGNITYAETPKYYWEDNIEYPIGKWNWSFDGSFDPVFNITEGWNKYNYTLKVNKSKLPLWRSCYGEGCPNCTDDYPPQCGGMED